MKYHFTVIVLTIPLCFTSCATQPAKPLPTPSASQPRTHYAIVDITNLYGEAGRVPERADYSVNGLPCGRGRVGFENMMDCISQLPTGSILIIDWRRKPFEPSAPLSDSSFPRLESSDEERVRTLIRARQWKALMPATILFEDWDSIIDEIRSEHVEFDFKSIRRGAGIHEHTPAESRIKQDYPPIHDELANLHKRERSKIVHSLRSIATRLTERSTFAEVVAEMDLRFFMDLPDYLAAEVNGILADEALRTKDPEVVIRIAKIAAEYRLVGCIPSLIDIINLQSPHAFLAIQLDPSVRSEDVHPIVGVLIAIGKPAVDPLLAFAADEKNASRRHFALAAVRGIEGPLTDAAIEEFCRRAADPDKMRHALKVAK